jgi:hypothetical protein
MITTEHAFYTDGESSRRAGCIRTAVSAIVGAALLALAGCGGGDGAGAGTVDSQAAAIHVSNLAGYCADKRTIEASGETVEGGPPTGSVEWLIRAARSAPDADVDGRTMRQVLADSASDLEPCAPQLAARLDRAVATLP